MAKTVVETMHDHGGTRRRDLAAFERYFQVTEGPSLPGDLRLLEYCAGSLDMPQDQLLQLLGLKGKVGTTI